LSEKFSSFLKKTNEFIFVLTLIALISLQVVLRKIFFAGNNFDKMFIYYSDLLFNILLGIVLWAYYVKIYSPDLIRKSIMGFFLTELILGIFLKKIIFPYSAEIMTIGLLGAITTWIHTHLNRHKFLSDKKEK
jgi:hypothetical protein